MACKVSTASGGSSSSSCPAKAGHWKGRRWGGRSANAEVVLDPEPEQVEEEVSPAFS